MFDRLPDHLHHSPDSSFSSRPCSNPPCLFVPLRVRLLVNRQTEEAVAVKVIDTSQAKECAENVKKEVCVHKVGQTPSIRLV